MEPTGFHQKLVAEAQAERLVRREETEAREARCAEVQAYELLEEEAEAYELDELHVGVLEDDCVPA